MAIISNPFVANGPKQLSQQELIQALRADIVGEYEAIIGYEAHAMATTDQRVKQALQQIAADELKHVGQLQELLNLLDPNEEQLLDQGRQKIQQQASGGANPLQQAANQQMQ